MSHTVEHWLGPDGPIAAAIGAGYEARDEQIRMAQAVDEAMEARTHLFVEAGTGTGKSFAYLVPALRRAVDRGERVLISTYTIALQEQLMRKDLPALTKVMAKEDGRELRSVLVKGRGNYVSLRRLGLASSRQQSLFPDQASRRSLHVIEDWAYETNDGTLSSLPVLERQGIWDRVQSDSHNCMGRRCPEFDRCFYQSARRSMEQADVLVCNHALFFSDLALRAGGAGFLPDYHHVILDEAHQVEDVAADHFGVSISEGKVNHLLSGLYQTRAGKGFLANLRTSEAGAAMVDAVVEKVQEAQVLSDEFFACLVNLLDRGKLVNGRVREPGVVEDLLSGVMSDLALGLRGLRECVQEEADRYELSGYAERAAAISDAVEFLVRQDGKDFVYWVDAEKSRGGGGGWGGGGGGVE